ncbi:hypothetical protein Tco_1531205 [Tanacetum coccineum]
MEKRIWSEDDRRRSKEFMEVIERRLKIRRIFRFLESFVSGSQNQRDLPRDNPLVSVEVLRSDTYTGNPVEEILLNLNLPDHSKDGDGDTSFQLSRFHNRMLILVRQIQRHHESSSICFKASETLTSTSS